MPWLQTTIEIINGAADPLTSRCSQGTTSSIPAPPGGLHAFTGCLAVVHRECRPHLGFVHEAKAKGALPSPPAHAWVDESALVSLTYSRSCPHTALLLYLKITFKSPSLGFLTVSLKKNGTQEILTWSKDGTQWPKCFISDLVLSRICQLLISLEKINCWEIVPLCQS